MLASLERIRQLDGIADEKHQRSGNYSLLLVDVSIFWQVLRLLYSYSGMAPIRQDMFLCFGLWHPYQYAHIALWGEFRYTFLAPAFFALFPEQRLLRRPKLVQSSIFFTWMRLAYPQFRESLQLALVAVKKSMLDWERERLLRVFDRKEGKKSENPHRSSYVHLLNLESLFEFCIPCIQDYGVTLKSNNWAAFLDCFVNLFQFFACCTSKGAHDYQRSMYCYLMGMWHWATKKLPIMDLYRQNHTLFSEESGEIALSVLVQSQPPATRMNLEATRQQWQLVGARYKTRSAKMNVPRSRRRVIGNPSYLFVISLCFVMVVIVLEFFRDKFNLKPNLSRCFVLVR